MGLRILHVAHTWPPAGAGGAELYAATLAEAQRASGHVVEPVVAGQHTPLGHGFTGSWRNSAADEAFSQKLREFSPDVVHFHHLSGLSLRLPALAHQRAVVVFTLHDYWLACARGQLINLDLQRCSGPTPERCAACLAPALWAPLPPRLARRLPLRLGPLHARQQAVAALGTAVDLFLSPSKWLAERLAFLGWPIQVLPLPLLRPLPPAPPPPPGPLRFLFIGALIPTKGVDIVLDAFARLPAGAATLQIVGPAVPYNGSRRWVDALIRRCNTIPGVTLLPPRPHEQIPALLVESDVLLAPSVWEENSPLVVLEARAAGLRLLASKIGGIPEIAPEATLLPPGDRDAWHRAMAALIAGGRRPLTPSPSIDLGIHVQELSEHYQALRRAR